MSRPWTYNQIQSYNRALYEKARKDGDWFPQDWNKRKNISNTPVAGIELEERQCCYCPKKFRVKKESPQKFCATYCKDFHGRKVTHAHTGVKYGNKRI